MKWINNYNLFESLEDSGENGIDVNYLRDCFIELIDRDITTVNSKSNFMNKYPMWQISITYKTERNNNIWTDHDGDISLLDDLLNGKIKTFWKLVVVLELMLWNLQNMVPSIQVLI